jgi:hypothetical protein
VLLRRGLALLMFFGGLVVLVFVDESERRMLSSVKGGSLI